MRNTRRKDEEKGEIEVKSKDVNEIKSSRADSTGSEFNERYLASFHILATFIILKGTIKVSHDFCFMLFVMFLLR